MRTWEEVTGVEVKVDREGSGWTATLEGKLTRNRKEVKVVGVGETPEQARDDLFIKARGCIVETPRGNFNTEWR